VLTRLKLPQPTTRKPVIELCVGGPIGRWMQRKGWGAFTLPLPVLTLILYWNTPEPSPGIRVHEFVHVYQTEPFFFITAWYRYLVQLAFYGYRNNRYEQEAYQIEQVNEIEGFPAWAVPATQDDEKYVPLLPGRGN